MKQWFRKAKKRLDRALLIILPRCLHALAGALPSRLLIWAGGLLGRISYALIARDRNRAIENLSRVFPERGAAWVRRTARSTFVHLGTSLMETLTARPQHLESFVTLRGMENLQTALAQGKGVVYVTGHIGNWEIMAAAVSQHHPVSVIAAPIDPEPLNEMIVDLRARLGIQTIVRSRPGAARDLIRVFRENRILGILIDQDTDVEGAFVDFLGRPAWTPTAAVQMSLKFGAPVVFGYIHRERTGRHTVTIEGPLELTWTGNANEDLRSNTAMLTKRIEQAILLHPEQWVWMHRRWRRQP
jgi:KDO2-lipid IV(A) lauroyltransferase